MPSFLPSAYVTDVRREWAGGWFTERSRTDWGSVVVGGGPPGRRFVTVAGRAPTPRDHVERLFQRWQGGTIEGPVIWTEVRHERVRSLAGIGTFPASRADVPLDCLVGVAVYAFDPATPAPSWDTTVSVDICLPRGSAAPDFVRPLLEGIRPIEAEERPVLDAVPFGTQRGLPPPVAR